MAAGLSPFGGQSIRQGLEVAPLYILLGTWSETDQIMSMFMLYICILYILYGPRGWSDEVEFASFISFNYLILSTYRSPQIAR